MGEFGNLFRIVIDNSVAKNWEEAKEEWNYSYSFDAEELQVCICGHYPIREICVIENRLNGNELKIGNHCITKFIPMDNEEKKNILAIKRVEKELEKSLGYYAIQKYRYLLTEWEYGFYVDTVHKRKLSEKQLTVRMRINHKILKTVIK